MRTALIVLASLAASALSVPSAADLGVCVPPGSAEATCIFIQGHANGDGRCDGFAENGGTVAIVQRDAGGDRSTYVQNGCYDGTDADGRYRGSYIGVYTYDSATGEQSGYHWNAGSHEAHGDYCQVGSIDGEPAVACPPIIDVPVVLDALL
ncbi:MAG TPA: hypothetical protein VJ874_01860 [Candidatus Thermoplasmatota archaeon]|nr:hypothetical protein [Candidatus Thermoplasmatota archaeon]